jgi:hypothetical protein
MISGGFKGYSDGKWMFPNHGEVIISKSKGVLERPTVVLSTNKRWSFRAKDHKMPFQREINENDIKKIWKSLTKEDSSCRQEHTQYSAKEISQSKNIPARRENQLKRGEKKSFDERMPWPSLIFDDFVGSWRAYKSEWNRQRGEKARREDQENAEKDGHTPS